jgi:hypothetical protein
MIDLKQPAGDTRLLWALGLHSAGIIAYQLVLMQLISIMQWYHFAYMIISIALLGFGASGTLIALFRNSLTKAYFWLVPVLMGLSGLFMLLAFLLARHPALQFDVYLLFVDRSQFKILAYNYLIYFIPFFTGALAIGLIFIKNADRIGKFYFSNLLGSGAGGVMAIVLLSQLFPLSALAICALIPVLAMVVLTQKTNLEITLPLATVTSIAIIVFWVSPGAVPMSEYKSLPKTLHLPEAEIVLRKPDIHGVIEVLQSPALRYAPALSLAYTGAIPIKKNVYTNGEFYGVIPQYDISTPNIHDFTSEALPYRMRGRSNVLILNATTGSAIAHALQSGAGHVDAVVELAGIRNLMEKDFAEQSNNLFHHPDVTIYSQDSRQFLFSQTSTHYDALILPRMESFGGSTGLHALHENYTLTIEAFEQMWQMLSPEGVIAITSWLDYPPRTTLKIAATLAQTLRNQGIGNPSAHIAAIRSWGTISFVVKKMPIDEHEEKNIREFCEEKFFDPVLLPTLYEHERERFNILEDNNILLYLDQIVNTKHPEILDAYDFYIHPPSDDKPYFGRYIKAGRLMGLYQEHGLNNIPFLELGYLIVWVTLIQGSLLALILIILPLLRLKGSGKSKTGTLIYFGALGLGYMFVEIILIQRFILYLGHPIYAISAVISVMLIASGIGSLYSGRLPDARKTSRNSTMIIVLLLLIYAIVLTPILSHSVHWPTAVKGLIAIILLAIPSFFMGMPFPSGIRLLHGYDPLQVAWAWGINGCLSVIATALATLIAVESGFRVVILLAMILYLIAFFTFYKPIKTL